MEAASTPRIVPRTGDLLAMRLNTSAANRLLRSCRRTGSATLKRRPQDLHLYRIPLPSGVAPSRRYAALPCFETDSPWLSHSGWGQDADSSSVHSPPDSASRSISRTIDALLFIGGFSPQDLHFSEGDCPLLVLWTLYRRSLSGEGPGFCGSCRAGRPKFAQSGIRQ